MRRLLSFDAYLIDLAQEAYLWLLDRTGVYVGTLVFALFVADHVCWGPLNWFDFVFLFLWGANCFWLYHLQSKDSRRLNDQQRRVRDWTPRPYLYSFCFLVLIGEAIAMNFWHFTGAVCWVIWSRLICVQVRDREPKEFFPSLKLARAGA